jgi:hypothetical protein
MQETILVLRERATPEQVAVMLQVYGTFIKLAVDVEREVVAGGGELHPDCEQALLGDGSRQADIWGADWIPSTQQILYEALINIRPKQNNPSMKILDPSIRNRIIEIVQSILGGV